MERTIRLLGLWTNLAWAVMATGVWVVNAIIVVTSDMPPSMDWLVFMAAMVLAGVSVGGVVHTVLALLRAGPYSDKASPDPAPDEPISGIISGIGFLGLATAISFSFGGPLAAMEWVVVGSMAFVAGFSLIPSSFALARHRQVPNRPDSHAVA